MVEKNFRSAERQSTLNSSIFLAESTGNLIVYIYLLYRSSAEVNLLQTHVLAIAGFVYILRVYLLALYLLRRDISFEEIVVVMLAFFPLVLSSFALNRTESTTAIQLVFGVAAYAIGSFLNTYSELQRKRWKMQPGHKGCCYTQGLFSASRNINYFGDVVLFSGWAMLTGVWWNAWVPIFMFLSFWFYHIPEKEKYLANRYAKEWPSYKKQTPWALVPYVC